jgi:acyl-coenzyme A synthetase/AMP-(fatty) acid ligase
MTFKCGGTVVLERSFAFPHAVLEKIAQEGVTGIPMVPTIAAILLQMDLTKYDFTSVRYLTNAGAGIPVEHVQKLRKLFPRVKIFLMYGQTECIRTSFLCPDEVDRRPNSVGKAMPNCEVFIVDEQGQRLPPGSVGELVVRGANVMLGYWELPGETAEVLRPGPLPGEKVLHSGDLFRMDEEGYLYFVSRRDDIIKVRGQRVGPREIEEVLCRMPGVREAVVVGVPDPILGNAIKAVIRPVIGASLTEQDVKAYCASHLEDVMVPKQIEFRDVLPVTESGKVSRKELKAEL